MLSGQWRRWRELKPVTGLLLFFAIAAPWHILCGLANPDQGHPVGNHPTPGNVHGFWYFYFVNEHVLRFLGGRFPHDYNKMPFACVLAGASRLAFSVEPVSARAARRGVENPACWMQHLRRDSGQTVDFYLDHAAREDVASYVARLKFRVRSTWLLALFSGFTLLFFAISTNQEYYTFPAWTPMLILIAGVLANIEEAPRPRRPEASALAEWLSGAQAVFSIAGSLVAVGPRLGLVAIAQPALRPRHWHAAGASRRRRIHALDVALLRPDRPIFRSSASARSHRCNRTADRSGAGLDAARAAEDIWPPRSALPLTSAVFLIAAHIAFARFEPMLSSKQLADTIVSKGSPSDSFIIYGDQSDASSVVFYTHNFLHKPAFIVMEPCSPHGNGSSLVWGSCYPDAPKIFLSDEQLSKEWGTGERKWLFAQDTNQPKAEQLLSGRLYPVQSIADKALWTDRPLK